MVVIKAPDCKPYTMQASAASLFCHFQKGAEIREKIMERLSIPLGSYTSSSIRAKDMQKKETDSWAMFSKREKRRQGLQLVCTRWKTALLEMADIFYEHGAFTSQNTSNCNICCLLLV